MPHFSVTFTDYNQDYAPLQMDETDGAAGPWVSYNKDTEVAKLVEHYATKVSSGLIMSSHHSNVF